MDDRDKFERVIERILEAARVSIVDGDPVLGMRGRFTRDCLVPVIEWTDCEVQRLQGEELPTSDLVVQVSHLVDTLAHGLGMTLAQVSRPLFQVNKEASKEAEVALIKVLIEGFRDAWASKVEGQKR